MDFSLWYNNPKEDGGGIPRYTAEMTDRLSAPAVGEVDFTSVYGGNAIEKFYNLLFQRENFAESQSNKREGLNHFLQPEIYYPSDKGTDIVTIHDLYPIKGNTSSLYKKIRHHFIENRMKDVIKHADHFIAVSEKTKSELISEGIQENKIDVISLGLNPKFQYINKYKHRNPILGYLESFRPHKRPDKLLEDWSSSEIYNKYSLKMGGLGGPLYNKLKNKYSTKKNTTFIGKVPEKDLVEYYNSLQALVFPSEYEGFGLPIIEALACGTPVIIYEDASITPELKQDCIIINSVSEIPDKLYNLHRQQIQNISNKIRNKYDWNKTVKDTYRVYRKVKNKYGLS